MEIAFIHTHIYTGMHVYMVTHVILVVMPTYISLL